MEEVYEHRSKQVWSQVKKKAFDRLMMALIKPK